MFTLPDEVRSRVERTFTTPVILRSVEEVVQNDGTIVKNFTQRTINALIAPRSRGKLRGEREYRAIDEHAFVIYTHRNEDVKIGDEVNINNVWLRVSFIYPNRNFYLAFLAIGDNP